MYQYVYNNSAREHYHYAAVLVPDSTSTSIPWYQVLKLAEIKEDGLRQNRPLVTRVGV